VACSKTHGHRLAVWNLNHPITKEVPTTITVKQLILNNALGRWKKPKAKS